VVREKTREKMYVVIKKMSFADSANVYMVLVFKTYVVRGKNVGLMDSCNETEILTQYLYSYAY
jgi:hypothetical protein